MKHTAKISIVGKVSRAPYVLCSAKGEQLDAAAVEITVDGNKPMTYRVEAWKDNKGMLRGLRKGMEVRVDGYLNSRTYNDALYYDLRAAAVYALWDGQAQPQHGQAQNEPESPQSALPGYQRGGSSYGYGNRQQGGYRSQQQGGYEPENKIEDKDIPF